MKNALIISGKIYSVKRSLFNPFGGSPCERCDLKRKCDNNQNCFCAPFEKKGFVPYFVLRKNNEVVSLDEVKKIIKGATDPQNALLKIDEL